MPPPIHGRVPEAGRTPTRAVVPASAPARPRAGTLSLRPRPALRVVGRPTRGQVRVVPTSAGPLPVAGVPVAVMSVPRVSVVPIPMPPQAVVPASAALEAAEGPEAGGPDTGAPAAGPAGTGSPAATATGAVKPTGTERRPRAGRLEQRATAGPARVSRFGPAAHAGSRQAAPRKPAAGPAAQRSRAGGR
jgi:hypothetical protein